MNTRIKHLGWTAAAILGFSVSAAQAGIVTMGKTLSLDGNATGDLIWRSNSSTTQAAWLMNGNYSSDASVIPTPTPEMTGATIVMMADLGGDGKADLLWRTPAGGYWLTEMNGLQIASTHGILPDAQNPGGDWVVVAHGDFNGDGKADLLWRRTSDGAYAIWQMNGSQIAPTDYAMLTPPQPGFEVVAVADFNGDGRDDLLWQDAAGSVYVQMITGIVSNSVVSPSTVAEGSMAGYTPSLIGDFNGDHRADIVWRSGTNDHKMWMMNGGTILSNTTLLAGGTNWYAKFARDLDADGKTDLIWEESVDHRVGMWLMNGSQAWAYGSLFNNPNPGWTLIHMADLNGDGKWDAIWKNDTDGSIATWLIAGGAAYAYAVVAGPGVGFTPQSLN